MKKNLIGLNLDELKTIFSLLGKPAFHGEQLFNWIYSKGVKDVTQMHNLGAHLQNTLAENYHINSVSISDSQKSIDKTQKWLLQFEDNHEAECVYIPEKNRGTLCISSQVGCTLTCKFCHTGTQTWVRNLTAGEIIGQVMHAKNELVDWNSEANAKKQITNVVMMGMGEPLYNYENVKKAILLMMHPKGINLSRHKITLSTSGVVPFIEKTAKELKVNIAVSLHAVTNELRNRIIPLNKKYPLEELLATLKNYCSLSQTKKVTFEYVMLKGVNDSETDAKELVKLIKGIPAKINLIPFNKWPGSEFECSTEKQIKKFSAIVENAGYKSPVRTPRGEDILAACGQLKSESKRINKSLLKGSC